jgi:PST family polysaccharide transporter
MLFRTSYKMSDSLARATGSVYRRAWRQIVYAALVVGGALVGQRWGIVGVAVAVVAALAVNFSLMAQLSLSVSGLSWASFLRVHLAPAALAAACAPVTWGVTTALRDAALPAIVVLAGGVIATLTWALLLAWRAPALFLGQDVLWMLETLRSYLPARLRRAGPAVAAPSPEAP